MDHNFYLAMSYGATAVAIAAELVFLALGRARAWKQVNEERELEAQD
jgi:heme exporter protein D